MKTIQKIEIFIGVFMLCGLLTNATVISGKDEKIDHSIRVSSAKEVMGTSYTQSEVKRFERKVISPKDISQTIHEKLPSLSGHAIQELTRTILKQSRRNGFDPMFVMAVIQTESKWNPNTVGSAGEIGLMQIRPETAKWIADLKKIKYKGARSLKDPATNVILGIAYMAHLRQQMGPNSVKYISAYNMGPGTVKRLLASNITPTTYRHMIIKNYESLYRGLARL